LEAAGLRFDLHAEGARDIAELIIPDAFSVPASVRLTLVLPEDGSLRLTRGQSYRFTFEAGGSDEVVLTFIGIEVGHMITCRMIDDGEFDLPAWVTERVQPSGTGLCIERHNIARHKETNVEILAAAGLIDSIPFFVVDP
jgi:hypothetical protein